MRFRALRTLLASLRTNTATLSYNCGSGTMNLPADIADDGRFEATGEHIRRGGAAPQPGDVPDRHAACSGPWLQRVPARARRAEGRRGSARDSAE